ncbi:FAD-dependent thymidylate synthase [Candidatus Saganbacteria bacterium]|nr:FAD-dependent thymidylate synthase [Candidatus Saganbacteria bacterium]
MMTMKILLAGYNVDTDVLAELKKGQLREDITPETLSASYARISRDPRPIDELRRDARAEVAKARESNAAIIFKMGHHSIAEHAVFNFDLIAVSRLALEEIEKFRLSAYTEKSQRYQQLGDDYVLPNEILKTKNEKLFIEIIKEQNQFYHKLVGEGIEPEDARYVTSLATQGQVGLTINARNLEFMFRRFASHPLAEIREIGQTMYKLVESIAPSIILFTQANDFDQKTYKELKAQSAKLKTNDSLKNGVKLVDYTKNADDKVIAALLHTSTLLSYKECLIKAKKMGVKAKKELLKISFKYAEFYDRPLREFEYADLTYDLIMSAACFGQLKRHRMATITTQPYAPVLGVTIPAAIKKSKLIKEFHQLISRTNKAYQQIAKEKPQAAQYVLTNAHRRRVLFKTNARELYHISRLREDPHAQWDISFLSREMTAQAKAIMPLTMLFIGGKDRYPEIYKKQFSASPKISP